MFRNYISTTRTLDLLPIRFLIVRLYALLSDIFLSRLQNHPAFDADPNALSFRIDNVKFLGLRFSLMIEEGYFGGYFIFEVKHSKGDDYMTWKTTGDTCRELDFQIYVDLDPKTICWILEEATLNYSTSRFDQGPLGVIPGVDDDDDDYDESAYMAALDRLTEDSDPNDHAGMEIQNIMEANDPIFQAEMDQFVLDYEATFDSINS